MENKTTTELLNLLQKTEKGANDSNSDELWQKVDEIREELLRRPPFNMIFSEEYDMSLDNFFNELLELKEEIKKLKRHKHDEKSGDVLIRI